MQNLSYVGYIKLIGCVTLKKDYCLLTHKPAMGGRLSLKICISSVCRIENGLSWFLLGIVKSFWLFNCEIRAGTGQRESY